MSQPPISPVGARLTWIEQVRERLKYSPRMLPDMAWTLTNNAVAVLSGIFVFKIVSRWVSATDYGQASLVLGFVGLLNQVVSSPAIAAHLRIYFEHAKEGLGLDYSHAVLKLLLRSSALMAAIYVVVAVGYLAVSNATYWSLTLPAVMLMFSQTQLLGTIAFLEGQKRYRAITIALSLSKALQVPFLILLLLISVSGKAAVVSSQMLAAASVVLIWFVWNPSQRNMFEPPTRDFSVAEVAKTASRVFGPSLYLFSIFSWVLATSDRYIIEHFWSAREVGLYALNYGLWSVPYITLNAWLEQVVRARTYERAEKQDWLGVRRLLRQRLALALALGVPLTVVIYFFGHWIALRIIGEKYWFGAGLMMLICTGHLFYLFAASFHVIFQAVKRADSLVWITFIASVGNVVANLVLVPRSGIIGAGWSTLGAYAAMFLMTAVMGTIVISRAAEGSTDVRG